MIDYGVKDSKNETFPFSVTEIFEKPRQPMLWMDMLHEIRKKILLKFCVSLAFLCILIIWNFRSRKQ